MKIWLEVILWVIVDSSGNIFITRGMKQVGEVDTLQAQQLLRLARRASSNPMIGLGVLCMTIAFFLFITLLSKADLSFILPETALGYPISLLGARYILKEKVTTARLIGTILVCIGVALVSFTNAK